jgi:hypothetical protein
MHGLGLEDNKRVGFAELPHALRKLAALALDAVDRFGRLPIRAAPEQAKLAPPRHHHTVTARPLASAAKFFHYECAIVASGCPAEHLRH